MMGLMYLGAAVLYLVVMFTVTRWAWRTGRANGGSRARGLAFALVGFLAVYLPLFWDLIPTVAAHRIYCARDAGFTVHVPAPHWRRNHEQEIQRAWNLPRSEREALSSRVQTVDGFSRITHFNHLLASDFKSEQIAIWGVNLRRLTWRTADALTGETLATAVDYQTFGADLRSWLNIHGCVSRPPASVGEQRSPVTPLGQLHLFKRRLQGEE